MSENKQLKPVSNHPPLSSAGELVQSIDWSRTSLGAMERWPRSLRTIVDMLLAHRFPCIVLWGPDLVQIYNDAYAVVAGGKHPAAMGMPTFECWPEVRHMTEPIYDRVLRQGESVLLEDTLFRLMRHGTIEDAYLTVSYSPVRDDEGRIGGVLATLFETTEKVRVARERAEESVRQERLLREIEMASRAKDQFLAVLSHELRTPLTPVVMTVAAIEQSPDLPAKLRADLAMVRRNVELESKLIDDLLDLSRVTTGKLPLHMQEVSAHDLIRHVADSCRSDTFGKRLTFAVDLAASADRVRVDPARLQQVIWNLVRNAIKFTPEQGTITLRTRDVPAGAGRQALAIEVQDTGVGIDPEVLPRIFNAFEQGDSKLTRQFGGLGLGLAIAKALVDLHGGSIRAASPGRGHGAAFTVELPAVAPAAALAPDPAAAPSLSDGSARAVKVLLVEDHDDTRRILARLLKASGYDVRAADCAAAAIELASAERFDVMLSDIGLPDATGYELMSQIRDRHAIPGIALSGYGMEDDIRRGREAGFVDHVVKPVNLAQLESALARVTGRVKG